MTVNAHINALIDSLALDHRRGAAEIVADIGALFLDIARQGIALATAGEHLFRRAVRRLAEGQPSMAPVLNLLNRICEIKELSQGDWERFSLSANEFINGLKVPSERMIQLAAQLPPAPNNLLTFSNSSTVARMIIVCQSFGWPSQVFVGEGRPISEGILMARKLTAAGVKAILMTDAALMSRIEEADAVWVGGDSLSHRGLVNKVGSWALAMLAKMQGIPFISLMTTQKLLSPGMLNYFKLLKQNPREIAADDTEGLNVVNEYYETVSLDLVRHVFTERGLCQPQELVSTMEREPVSPLFQSIVLGRR